MRFPNPSNVLLTAAASMSTLVAIDSAYAQAPATPNSAAEATPAPSPSSDNPEIVVTAQKRVQNLNDVGLAVSVLGGRVLQERQINSLADLANAVPSLSYATSANNTPVYTLRGVGFYETSLSAYPTVSVYLDEFPLAFPALTKHSAFDLERVEVLKGPQGTLFGQNATGGAINFIAAKPTNRLRTGLSLTYGRFNSAIAEGYVSGPLAQGLKVRLSGRIEQGAGWQISNTRPDDRLGKQRNYMGRLLIDAQPSERLRLQLNLNGWVDKSDTQAPQYIALYPQNPLVDPDILNAHFSPEKPRAADWTPGLPFADNSMGQANFRADYELSDAITLTSLTGLTYFSQKQGDEGDGLPAVSLDLPLNRGKINSFFQEVRLANGSKGPFRWVLGANYEHSKIDQAIDLAYPNSSSHETLGTIGYPITGGFYTSNQKLTNYAAFGNVELDVGQLTLKTGLRYTSARRDAQICNADKVAAPNGVGAFFYNVLLGGAFGSYSSGKCFAINTLPIAVGAVQPGAPGRYDAQLNEHNLSYRAGVDWKPRRNLIFYGNIAKGYKAGSFPTLAASTFQQYLPVKQESVLSFEAGSKATIADGKIQFDVAAFYYKYTDKQIRAKLIDPVFGILDVLQNIPKSSIKGLEVSVTARPVHGLSLTPQFTYLDAKINQFNGINGAGVSQNFKGARVPYTPKYQVGIDGAYEVAVSESLRGFIGATLTYRSDTVAVIGGDANPPAASPQNKKIFGIDAYALVDLRLGIKSADDRWRAQIWGKNVFNTYYWTNVVAAFDTVGRYAGMPATYGVSLSFNY